MGHLSNPIGFRLTFEKKWNFTFFVKNIYYPEVINTLINLRDYIYYYLTRKKILQSGISLSHFMLSKHFKKYYIKIYIYHIDLEKTGYDLMNKFYHMYYAIYNEISHKYDKNKTAKQVKLYHYLRDLSNSDVYIYLFIYILFYKGKRRNKTFFLNNNIYNINTKIKNYYKLIVYTFFKQFLYYYAKKKKISRKHKLRVQNIKMKLFNWMKILKNINKLYKNWSVRNFNTVEKNIKIAKIKGLILYKAKKLIKIKPLTYYMVKNCNYLKKRVLTSMQQLVIKLAWKITQTSIKNKIKKLKKYTKCVNVMKEKLLLQNALQKFKKNYKHFFWIGKYKKHSLLRLKSKKIVKLSKINKKIKKKIVKLKEILFDKPWDRAFPIILKNSIKSINLKNKVDPFTLFFFLSKKTGFQKVKNTYTLWKKWTTVFKYIQLFNEYNFLYKEMFFYNINYFFFYIKIAIWHSIRMRKNFFFKHGNYFNLRDLIFSCLQQGLYITFFRSNLIWLNIFLKMGLSIIHNASSYLNKMDLDQMILSYFFISNNNVTAPFLARYIVLKLKRGFTVVKTLNPLKRELIKVSKKSRNKAYSNYLFKLKKKQNFIQKKIKILMLSYKKSCKVFYDYFLVKFYNNNNIIITPSLFSYFWHFKEKIKICELSFSRIWRDNILLLLKQILYNYIKYCIYKKIYKKKLIVNVKKVKLTIKKFIKIFNLNYCIIYVKYKLFKNIKFRHGLWLFFLLFFRYYEKKKKYRSYKKVYKTKTNLLKNYKLYQKLNERLYISLQVNKTEVDILEAKHKMNIYSSNFFSMYNLCNNFILYKNKKKINIFKITFSNFFNRHYINYAILKILWNVFNKINLRNERDLYIHKYKSLIMGFKMVLKGRFSRKQRASKITLLKGKVPLNTFKMKVDYAFAHITLKNSAISLKFYLYKSPGIEIYKRSLII